MNKIYFYRGYIVPNKKSCCYIFKYKDSERALAIKYGNNCYFFTQIADSKQVFDVYLKEYFEKNPKSIAIDTLRISSIYDSVPGKLFVDIIGTEKGYYVQMYNKKFQGNYKKISYEKLKKLQQFTYSFFWTGKEGSTTWVRQKTFPIFQNIKTVRGCLGYKNGQN